MKEFFLIPCFQLAPTFPSAHGSAFQKPANGPIRRPGAPPCGTLEERLPSWGTALSSLEVPSQAAPPPPPPGGDSPAHRLGGAGAAPRQEDGAAQASVSCNSGQVPGRWVPAPEVRPGGGVGPRFPGGISTPWHILVCPGDLRVLHRGTALHDSKLSGVAQDLQRGLQALLWVKSCSELSRSDPDTAEPF